jgi:hypothetical protein
VIAGHLFGKCLDLLVLGLFMRELGQRDFLVVVDNQASRKLTVADGITLCGPAGLPSGRLAWLAGLTRLGGLPGLIGLPWRVGSTRWIGLIPLRLLCEGGAQQQHSGKCGDGNDAA